MKPAIKRTPFSIKACAKAHVCDRTPQTTRSDMLYVE